jgi:hypothetical protein
VFLLVSSYDIECLMVWAILFLPLGIWLGISIISYMDIFSIGGIFLTVAIFTLVEVLQVSQDKERSKIPLWIMCLMLLSIVLGVCWK